MPSSLEAAAIRWVWLRARAAELARERVAIDCERTPPNPDPCWRTYDRSKPGPNATEDDPDWQRFDEGTWCAPCRRRERVHRELRSTAAARGAALRVLLLRVRQASTPDLRVAP